MSNDPSTRSHAHPEHVDVQHAHHDEPNTHAGRHSHDHPEGHGEASGRHDSHDAHAHHEGHGGHDHGHAGHGDHVGQFRRLFWIMLVLAVPVVGFNDMFAHLIGYHLPEAAWVSWVSPILGTVVYFWGGWPFLTGGLSEIRSRKPEIGRAHV